MLKDSHQTDLAFNLPKFSFNFLKCGAKIARDLAADFEQ